MASFFTELKRRNVFKVGVAYAIVSWLLIQIMVAVETPLNLPNWVDTLTIIFLIIGFPVAIIIAWAFELTPEGIKSSKSVAPEDSIRAETGHKLNHLITGMVALAVLFLIIDNYVLEEAPKVSEPVQQAEVTEPAPLVPETALTEVTEPEEDELERLPNSVAILPCANLSPDPDNAFFAAGIHESTLNQLAKINDLMVMSRTSVLQYENNPPPIREIAEALNIEMVMECSVRYANERVLITAQLIDGLTGAHLWSEDYDRELTDIFAVQAEIADNIAMALEAELLPSEMQRIQKIQTSSSEALALYLQAYNITTTISGVGPNDELHRLLDQAIRLDPSFARAHALKAFDYSYAIIRTRLSDGLSISELERLALQEAGIALAFDSEENLAYVALANVFRMSWRAIAANAAFERALELAPNDFQSLNVYSHFLSTIEDYDRAITLAKRANELDPPTVGLSAIYVRAGYFDAAFEEANNYLNTNDTNPQIYLHLAVAEWHRGNYDNAYSSIQITEELLTENQFGFLPNVILVYGLLGKQEDALRLFQKLEQMATTNYINAGLWAKASIGIEDYVQALNWLNRIVEERNQEDSITTAYIAINEFHHPGLNRPEFVDVLNRLKFKR